MAMAVCSFRLFEQVYTNRGISVKWDHPPLCFAAPSRWGVPRRGCRSGLGSAGVAARINRGCAAAAVELFVIKRIIEGCISNYLGSTCLVLRREALLRVTISF
jgi:hypothetical protein